jgi:hypothetical protein
MFDNLVEPEFQAKGDPTPRFTGCHARNPIGRYVDGTTSLALADGPTEVHKVQVAKAFLKGVTPAPGMFPTDHIPTRLEAVKLKYAKELGHV